MLQLLFLAKAASHKLYCNYRPADDFYHLFGHMWSFARRVFQLCVKKKDKKKVKSYTFFFFHRPLLHILRVILRSTGLHPLPPFFFFFFSFFFSSTTSQSHDRCWADIKPAAVFFFFFFLSPSPYAAFHDSFSRQSLALEELLPEEMSLRTGNYFSSPCCCTRYTRAPQPATDTGAINTDDT